MNSMENTPAVPAGPQGQATPGQMLRAARQAKGLHLAVLSVTLKVPTQQLEALENDQYEVFKGVAFVRALAQSLCRQLGIDPAPVLAGLPKTGSPNAIAPKAINTAVSGAPQGLSSLRGKGPSRLVLLLAALMLGVSAALLWWPQGETVPVSPDMSEPNAVPMGQANDPVETPVEPAASEPPAAVPPAPPPPVEAPVVKPPAPAAAPVATPSPPSPAASQAQAMAGDAPLIIQPTTDTWIEVRDGRGQMAVKRMVKAGEVLQLEVALPLFVYVGRADTTTVSWRGKAVDLKPHTTHNEARLQIRS